MKRKLWLVMVWGLLCLPAALAEAPDPNDDLVPDQIDLDNLEKPLLGGKATDRPESSVDQRLQAFIDQGRDLFADPGLGTSGKACLACHQDPAASLGGKIQTYPKFSKVAGTVINDVHQVNLCLTKPMKGQPLNADDERMTALLAYLKSLVRPD
ncbi:MAG: hypothetical protein GX442_07165 [Candidatus Riflebacteria bacterium]|nr:hypothetical protein [Candidatus Riflebacteria bacterium]